MSGLRHSLGAAVAALAIAVFVGYRVLRPDPPRNLDP
jgi:hypothetical protein